MKFIYRHCRWVNKFDHLPSFTIYPLALAFIYLAFHLFGIIGLLVTYAWISPFKLEWRKNEKMELI